MLLDEGLTNIKILAMTWEKYLNEKMIPISITENDRSYKKLGTMMIDKVSIKTSQKRNILTMQTILISNSFVSISTSSVWWITSVAVKTIPPDSVGFDEVGEDFRSLEGFLLKLIKTWALSAVAFLPSTEIVRNMAKNLKILQFWWRENLLNLSWKWIFNLKKTFLNFSGVVFEIWLNALEVKEKLQKPWNIVFKIFWHFGRDSQFTHFQIWVLTSWKAFAMVCLLLLYYCYTVIYLLLW